MPTATQIGVLTIGVCIVFVIATIIFGLGFSIVPVRFHWFRNFFPSHLVFRVWTAV
jgi:hypothetical protein